MLIVRRTVNAIQLGGFDQRIVDGFDMLTSTSKKPGFGHSYSAENYIDAWLEVTEPEGWSEVGITRLKDHFRK